MKGLKNINIPVTDEIYIYLEDLKYQMGSSCWREFILDLAKYRKGEVSNNG